MQKYYVYKFFNLNQDVVYVGKTINYQKRMNQHFNGAGHLNERQYDSVVYIDIAEVSTKTEMDMYERYLIDIIEPDYNTQFVNREDKVSFRLPELNWFGYVPNIKTSDEKKSSLGGAWDIGKLDRSEFVTKLADAQRMIYEFDVLLNQHKEKVIKELPQLNLDSKSKTIMHDILFDLQELVNYKESRLMMYYSQGMEHKVM